MTTIAVNSNAPVRVPALLVPGRPVADLWRHRDLIRQFTAREVRGLTKGTALGLSWQVITPLVRLVIFALVFGEVIGIRFSEQRGGADYAFFLLCGLLVFGIFGQTVTQAGNLVRSKSQYVTKVVFPIEILPVTQLGANLVVALVELVILVVGFGLVAGRVSETLWLAPVVLIPTAMLALGVAWVVASLGAFLQDVREMTRLLVGTVLFFMTPIIFPLEQVQSALEGKKYVSWIAWVVEQNPLTVLVGAGRDVMLNGRYPDWWALGLVTVQAVVLFHLGYAFFVKSKRGFADVL